MGQVARFRRLPDDKADLLEDEASSDWSPRARILTVIGAALASWAVIGAVIYLVVAAFWG